MGLGHIPCMVYSLAGISTCFPWQLTVFSGNHCRYGGAWLGNLRKRNKISVPEQKKKQKFSVMQRCVHMAVV